MMTMMMLISRYDDDDDDDLLMSFWKWASNCNDDQLATRDSHGSMRCALPVQFAAGRASCSCRKTSFVRALEASLPPNRHVATGGQPVNQI